MLLEVVAARSRLVEAAALDHRYVRSEVVSAADVLLLICCSDSRQPLNVDASNQLIVVVRIPSQVCQLFEAAVAILALIQQYRRAVVNVAVENVATQGAVSAIMILHDLLLSRLVRQCLVEIGNIR